MTTNLELAASVARYVQIHSIRLSSARMQSELDVVDVPNDLSAEMGFRGRYELREAHSDFVFVNVDLKFSVSDSAVDNNSSLLTLEASYEVAYALEEAATYPTNALKHFAELNGPYNVWPYWRELVQTVTGRAGLTSIVVPVFRPEVAELNAESDQIENVG